MKREIRDERRFTRVFEIFYDDWKMNGIGIDDEWIEIYFFSVFRLQLRMAMNSNLKQKLIVFVWISLIFSRFVDQANSMVTSVF